MWPRALPLDAIFGPEWDGGEIRSRFLTLANQWNARNPALSGGDGPTDGPQPGQWMWHPPAHRVYDCHTYDGPGDDWLEVAILVETADYSPGRCRIAATLTIACRCEGGHGQHTIVQTQWRSGGPDATLNALTSVLRSTDEWLAGSRSPASWRRHAGLT